jgi:DNA-directed RNA polymerase specialized sigma24 family protein
VIPTFTYDSYGTVLRSPASRLDWLIARFGARIRQWIREVTRGLLSPEDLEDAYQETLRDAWIEICDKEPAPERYLPLIRTIARRKGIDALRRRGHSPHTNSEEALASLVDLRGQRLGPLEWLEVHWIVRDTVAGLPPRQRLVAQCYLDHYWEFGLRDTFERLAKLVRARSGKPVTITSVKKLWHRARAKLIAALRRGGYGLNE